MKNTKLLSILNFAALLIQLGLSVIVQLKLINSRDVGDVSAQFTSLFTPAGYTFSIWGLIYVALTAMCIYHLIVSFSARPNPETQQDIAGMGYWFVLNNLATSSWLLAFTAGQIILSEILIVFQLICLVLIHSRLHIYRTKAHLSSKLLTQVPLSIYLGWISVATIANSAVTLQQLGWNGWGASEPFWTSTMIGVGIVLTLVMVLARQNIWFGGVYIWALFGILSRLQEMGTPPPAIISFIWTGIGLTGFAIIVQLFRSPAQSRQMAGSLR